MGHTIKNSGQNMGHTIKNSGQNMGHSKKMTLSSKH